MGDFDVAAAVKQWAPMFKQLGWQPDHHPGPHDVEALCESLARVLGERDRLARILAVERGEEGQAPEGWTCPHGGAWYTGEDDDVSPFAWVERARGEHGRWVWDATCGGLDRKGEAPSALEAMEAADAALEALGRGE